MMKWKKLHDKTNTALMEEEYKRKKLSTWIKYTLEKIQPSITEPCKETEILKEIRRQRR